MEFSLDKYKKANLSEKTLTETANIKLDEENVIRVWTRVRLQILSGT